MVRWETADTEPQPWHRRKIAEVLKVSLEELHELLADIIGGAENALANPPDHGNGAAADQGAESLRERLLNAAAVDDHAVALLAAQADRIREVDRMLGARAAEAQMRGHLAALDLLRAFGISPNQREPLARLYADAATLAGWQCLDLGELSKAWQYYEAAKNAAREGNPPAALAHAMAEQAYVLVELGEVASALQLAEYARATAGTAVPPLLSSWLSAVQGELYAATGNDAACRRAFETADRLLPDETSDPELPYVILDGVHLARWRGNAWARLGDAGATDDLQQALHGLDPTFTRAKAGLRVDLAQALAVAKQHTEARAELSEAKTLATRVGSARQRRRIRQLESALQAA